MAQESTPPIPPRFAVRAALSLRTALLRAADKIVPPQVKLIEMAFGYEQTMLVRVAARYKIADAIGGTPQTAAELARRVNLDPDALHRTLRALVAHGIFEVDDQGRFFNNRLSDVLRERAPGSMLAWARYCGSKSNMTAWADFERTVETGKNAFERVHGKDCWTWFGEHPEEGRDFAQAMVDLTDLQGPVLAAAYPFSQFNVICDVAGGRGALLASIIARHPSVRGMLVDEAYVLEQAGTLLAARGIADRVERRPGNMFVEVPRGADAYILKDIIHDWDDERAIKILSNVRKAMDQGSKLLLIEIVVEPNDISHPGPSVDLHMMVVCCDGRQRSSFDFRRILADAGFRLQRIVPTSAPASIVEAMAI